MRERGRNSEIERERGGRERSSRAEKELAARWPCITHDGAALNAGLGAELQTRGTSSTVRGTERPQRAGESGERKARDPEWQRLQGRGERHKGEIQEEES